MITYTGLKLEHHEFTGRLPTEEEVIGFDVTYSMSLTDCDIDSFEPVGNYAGKHSRLCCGLSLNNCRVRDWDSLKHLSLWILQTYRTGITDLSAIGRIRHGFNDIILLDENITDISPLGNIFQPQRITIVSSPGLTDISALKGKKTLRLVDFDFCGVSDLSPLAGLPKLERLRVSRNPVSDFSVLRSNPNLKFLKWKSDDESSTASDTLSELTQLRTLFIGGKAIKNLEFLRGMTSLTKLSLFMCNDSCDCTMLKEINNLRNLSISDCNVPDTSFLFEMPWLERLCLQRSMFNEEEAQRITEAYPDGVVSFYEEEPLKN